MRKFLLAALAAVLLLGVGAGCVWQEERLPSEDIDVLTKFAPEIAILKNRQYSAGSKEKYEAAERLAAGVDFSFTRNVLTLEDIFDPRDATRLPVRLNEEFIIFSYSYGNKVLNFNFARTNNAVTNSEVVFRDAE